MDFRQSKAYLILDTKLKCLYENFSDNSIQTRMIDSLLAEKVFVDDSKFDYEIIFQKYFSSPTFKKAMKAYSDQIMFVSFCLYNYFLFFCDKKHLFCLTD